MLDDTKLIKNGLLSMFFMAKVASEGIFGLSFIISIDISLIDSIIVANSSSFFFGRISFTSLIFALK